VVVKVFDWWPVSTAGNVAWWMTNTASFNYIGCANTNGCQGQISFQLVPCPLALRTYGMLLFYGFYSLAAIRWLLFVGFYSLASILWLLFFGFYTLASILWLLFSLKGTVNFPQATTMDGNIVLDFGGWSNPTNIFVTPRMLRIPVPF
jgi:hypothetical protein